MRLGFALRSTVFHPSLIPEAAALLDRAGVDEVWFPDVGGSFDALDLCAVALGATRRARFGTGVIRAGEQDAARLAVRARTLAESSGGRFVLGLGAGSARGPSAVKAVADLAADFRRAYGTGHPPVFFAALREAMLREAVLGADGAILNFCPPSYVSRILPGERPRGFTVACYVKVFFSERGDADARRALVEEVSSYDRYPGYRAMFKEAGLAGPIALLEPGARDLPDPILEFVRANPSQRELEDLLEAFARAGVDVPVVYPYVSGGRAYQVGVLERLSGLAAPTG